MKTLEQLCEDLNGRLWEKAGKKRIYLEAGHNTKKMKTTAYVEEIDGKFVVKCFIDCPSQPYQWIKSQQEEVIEGIERQIDRALATEYYYVVNTNGDVLDDSGRILSEIGELYEGGGLYLSKAQAESNMREEDLKTNMRFMFKAMCEVFIDDHKAISKELESRAKEITDKNPNPNQDEA